MTVYIALCDDEAADMERTKALLNAYGQKHDDAEFVFQCFENSNQLLAMVSEGNYLPDLVFLDIYMPDSQGKNVPMGMKAARQLRSMGSEAKLIFLTASREYALEAFDVEASCYLVKPVSEERLFAILDRFFEEAGQESRKYILLKTEGRIVKVPLNDMVYCEAQRKCQRICMADGTELLQKLTMAKIYDMCSACQEFVRVGASYIINLEHIDSLNAQEVLLDTGQKIYLPRGTYRSLREQYFAYYCGKE
ncbi:MAG: LytTR family DNA-binding domain-containing protein [Ruminococcus flavefaciens]|nr:LytTR family DNA-binding domain-containing protein [Ruminococcus flavefaciens]